MEMKGCHTVDLNGSGVNYVTFKAENWDALCHETYYFSGRSGWRISMLSLENWYWFTSHPGASKCGRFCLNSAWFYSKGRTQRRTNWLFVYTSLSTQDGVSPKELSMEPYSYDDRRVMKVLIFLISSYFSGASCCSFAEWWRRSWRIHWDKSWGWSPRFCGWWAICMEFFQQSSLGATWSR
jgi:hypothetical protein